jgi:phenylalanine-4-hydroxylase
MSSYIVEQEWSNYTETEHALWRQLLERQNEVLPNRVVPEFLEGLEVLEMDRTKIPRFTDLSCILRERTNWEIVPVVGLVPDDVFFDFLADRKFPCTTFIRKPEQIDYLQEPDLFHDVFGHVPLLIQPIFADYMQAYGKAGQRANGTEDIHFLARLYWYTVEFGLIQTSEGLRTYGSGVVSSYTETKYCLEDSTPNRLMFDLRRVMRTNYRIDDFQETYFVIPSFEVLFEETQQNLRALYDELRSLPDYKPGQVIETDQRLSIVN